MGEYMLWVTQVNNQNVSFHWQFSEKDKKQKKDSRSTPTKLEPKG